MSITNAEIVAAQVVTRMTKGYAFRPGTAAEKAKHRQDVENEVKKDFDNLPWKEFVTKYKLYIDPKIVSACTDIKEGPLKTQQRSKERQLEKKADKAERKDLTKRVTVLEKQVAELTSLIKQLTEN